MWKVPKQTVFMRSSLFFTFASQTVDPFLNIQVNPKTEGNDQKPERKMQLDPRALVEISLPSLSRQWKSDGRPLNWTSKRKSFQFFRIPSNPAEEKSKVNQALKILFYNFLLNKTNYVGQKVNHQSDSANLSYFYIFVHSKNFIPNGGFVRNVVSKVWMIIARSGKLPVVIPVSAMIVVTHTILLLTVCLVYNCLYHNAFSQTTANSIMQVDVKSVRKEKWSNGYRV